MPSVRVKVARGALERPCSGPRPRSRRSSRGRSSRSRPGWRRPWRRSRSRRRGGRRPRGRPSGPTSALRHRVVRVVLRWCRWPAPELASPPGPVVGDGDRQRRARGVLGDRRADGVVDGLDGRGRHRGGGGRGRGRGRPPGLPLPPLAAWAVPVRPTVSAARTATTAVALQGRADGTHADAPRGCRGTRYSARLPGARPVTPRARGAGRVGRGHDDVCAATRRPAER